MLRIAYNLFHKYLPSILSLAFRGVLQGTRYDFWYCLQFQVTETYIEATFFSQRWLPSLPLMGVNDHKDISDQTSIINVKEEHWLEPNWFKQCKPTNSNNTKITHMYVLFCSVASLCNPGNKPGSLALQEDSLPAELPGEPNLIWDLAKKSLTVRVPD